MFENHSTSTADILKLKQLIFQTDQGKQLTCVAINYTLEQLTMAHRHNLEGQYHRLIRARWAKAVVITFSCTFCSPFGALGIVYLPPPDPAHWPGITQPRYSQAACPYMTMLPVPLWKVGSTLKEAVLYRYLLLIYGQYLGAALSRRHIPCFSYWPSKAIWLKLPSM